MATSFLLSLSLFVAIAAAYLQKDDRPGCEYLEFVCESGECIDRKKWCNGPPDCIDSSDENYCRTAPGSNINGCDKSRYFVCDDAVCIPKSGRCNDIPDCSQGEDEENCDYLYETSEELKDTTTTSTTTTTTAMPVPKLRGDLPWIPSRFDVLHKSVRHIVEERDARWGWGKATSKIITSLYLANETYFQPDNYDGLMTKKELEVQLALDLLRNAEKPLKVHELVQYIHALLVTCMNPRDFHGVNMVKLLKKSIAKRQAKGLFVHPIAYLALCNAGELPDNYIRRLKNIAFRRTEEPRWLDVQTCALLAIACHTSKNGSSPEWLSLKRDVVRDISEWQQEDGSFGSIHSTGLALQALIAAEEVGTETVKGRALTYLLMQQDWQGSYGNALDNFYVLPALSLKSLATLHRKNCKFHTYAPQGIEAAGRPAKKEKILVHYSLWLGGEKNEIHTLSVALNKHSDFLELMREAEAINPRFKHSVMSMGKGAAISSIDGRSSDIERSIYWTLYRRVPLPFRPNLTNVTATVSRLKLLGAKKWTKDLRKLHPRDGEHLAFWYKPYL